MKICILVHDLIPYSLKASAKMIYDLANEIASQGHQITIILPAPELSVRYELIQNKNISIYRFKTGQFENAPKVKRAISETFLSYNAWKNLKKVFQTNPHDYIIYYSPTIFWGRLVYRLKKLWKVKSYLILRDFFPQWVIDNGMLREKSIITKYFLFFENLNYRVADTIGIQSPNNLKWFIENRKVKAKLEVLYNWAADLRLTKKSSFYRDKLGLTDKIVFFYGGNMGPAQDMKNIIRLAKRMQNHPEAVFVMVGSGYEVDLIKTAILSKEVNNIIYLDPVSPDEYLKMLSEFDIGLFCLNKNHKTHNFPGKVLGYLVQGIPVLGCVNPGNDLIGVIHEANAGLISISEDEEQFYNNARFLLENENRILMGNSARKLLEQTFSVKSAVEQILTKVNKLNN